MAEQEILDEVKARLLGSMVDPVEEEGQLLPPSPNDPPQ